MVISTTWQHIQTRFSEWFGAIALLGWGIYVTLHPGMMTDDRTHALWAGMLSIMPQESWGLAAAMTGLARVGALYVNGNHRKTPIVRLITSFFSAFVWTQISVGLIKAGVPNTGIWLYPCLVAADIYSTFRASGDVTLVSRRVRVSNGESRSGRSNGSDRSKAVNS